MPPPLPKPVVARGTSYDAFPCPSSSFPDTHPNRLAAMARLMGIPAASPSASRVLELGCSDGGNLLLMAETAPGSSYLGLDSSHVQIAAGKRAIAAVGLPNVELRHQDIAAFGKKEGVFDYIIMHGVFSWVHVLAACDGARTVEEIEAGLREKFAAGTLVLREAGEPVTGAERLDAMLGSKVPAALHELAQHGLFAQRR